VIPKPILYNNMKSIRAIITSRPGTWQKFLQNDVGSYPFVNVVAVANGSLTTIQMVKQHQPYMLLVDSSIPAEETNAILNNIKRETPSVLIVVIADTYQLQRSFNKAGADYVVSTYEFKSKIQEIFNKYRETYQNATGSMEEASGTNL